MGSTTGSVTLVPSGYTGATGLTVPTTGSYTITHAYKGSGNTTTYSRITIRSQKTRWGGCSAKGNLNFNCLLMLMPQEVRDYVVIHELCHRREMNHSAAFWTEVERYCPDYRLHRKWLKDNGAALIGRLP